MAKLQLAQNFFMTAYIGYGLFDQKPKRRGKCKKCGKRVSGAGVVIKDNPWHHMGCTNAFGIN